MSRKSSKRVSFSPDPDANDEPIFPKHGGFSSSRHVRKRVAVGIFSFSVRLQKSSPARLLRRLGARVAKTLRFISLERKSCSSSVRKVSSCSSSNYLARSRSLAESESHRAEAIEDCIEFLNSSSSLSRSNSVSTCSC